METNDARQARQDPALSEQPVAPVPLPARARQDGRDAGLAICRCGPQLLPSGVPGGPGPACRAASWTRTAQGGVVTLDQLISELLTRRIPLRLVQGRLQMGPGWAWLQLTEELRRAIQEHRRSLEMT